MAFRKFQKVLKFNLIVFSLLIGFAYFCAERIEIVEMRTKLGIAKAVFK